MMNSQVGFVKISSESLGHLDSRVKGSGALRWIIQRHYLLEVCEWMAFCTSDKWMPQIIVYAANKALNELPRGSASCSHACYTTLMRNHHPHHACIHVTKQLSLSILILWCILLLLCSFSYQGLHGFKLTIL